MKGKIIKKENSLWVQQIVQEENYDAVNIKQYPLSISTMLYNSHLSLGDVVEFSIQKEVYTELGEEIIHWAIINSKLNRLEIINYNSITHKIGKIFSFKGNIKVSYQNNNQTLKIFI